jgi:hypothetical protein
VLQFHVSDFVERAHGQLGCVEIEQRDIKLVSAECAAIGETIESFVAKDFGNNLGRRITDVNGDNPAIIHIGDTYADLSATITGSQGDLNLGIKTFLNDRLVSNIVLDTTAMATDTIDYVTTDDAGLTSTSTSTRTVLIEAANDNQASTTPANDNPPPLAATGTTATSSSQ